MDRRPIPRNTEAHASGRPARGSSTASPISFGASLLALQAQAGNAAVNHLLSVSRQSEPARGTGAGQETRSSTAATLQAADQRAVDEIRQVVPGTEIEPVLAFARGAGVSGREILRAIRAGGSAPLLTATAFTTLRAAGEPGAELILHGQIRVAEMSDTLVQGSLAAAYSAEATTMPDGTTPLTAADTFYIRHGTSIDNPMDRSYIVHEAAHAIQDASRMSGSHLDAEVDAYQTQARYMYQQLDAAPADGRPAMARSFGSDLSSSLQAALLDVALSQAGHEQAFIDILGAQPTPVSAGAARALLATPRAVATHNLRQVISAEYGQAQAAASVPFSGVMRGR